MTEKENMQNTNCHDLHHRLSICHCFVPSASIGSIDAVNAQMPVLGSGRSACSLTYFAHVGRRATSASMICSAETTHGHAHCLRRNKATNHSNDSPLFALSKCQLSNGVLLWTLPTPHIHVLSSDGQPGLLSTSSMRSTAAGNPRRFAVNIPINTSYLGKPRNRSVKR